MSSGVAAASNSRIYALQRLVTATGTATTSGTTTSSQWCGAIATFKEAAALPTVQFSAASSSGSEAITPAVFNVTLSSAAAANVVLPYTLTAGTAIAGTNFTSTPGTLTIIAGQTTGQINVPILNDSVQTTNRTFTVNLGAVTSGNATTGSPASNVFTIIDANGPKLLPHADEQFARLRVKPQIVRLLPELDGPHRLKRARVQHPHRPVAVGDVKLV